jgi:glycolate oxidase iron-sulfur subunit
MKTLKDYSEEIYKCTKCGLCQAVCPVFEATGLESAVSRGKFTLLNAALNGKLDFNKNLSKYLDLCLGCKACYDFCPSGISAEEIIIAAKFHNHKLGNSSFLKQFIVSSFNSRFKLFLLKILLTLYKQSGLIKLVDLLTSKVKLEHNVSFLFNMQLKEHIKYKKLSSVGEKSELKLAYFPGCINNYVNSSVKNSVLMVLERNGFNLNIPGGLSCCGIPARSTGDIDTFVELAKNNLDKIDTDIDYLITDCATCGSAWKIYAEILDDKDLKEKAEIIASKVIDINKFLAMHNIYIPENVAINKKVTYHDPCHLKRFQGVYKEPRDVLRKLPGVVYIELEEADKCCGSAGTFCIGNPEISKVISMRKAENILNTEAEIIATACPSCKIGIYNGLCQTNKYIPVYHPVELLAELYLREFNLK